MWVFTTGDWAPQVAESLGFHCIPIILCVSSAPTSGRFEVSLFLETFAQMDWKISVHVGWWDPAVGRYTPYISAELVCTKMLF